MSSRSKSDPFAALFLPEVEQMPTAWRHLRVPGPPVAFRLRADEAQGAPAQRFARRTILAWNCAPPAPDESSQESGLEPDRLALIDKASPHAHFDLMLSEVSTQSKSTPDAVLPITGLMVWRSALEFVRFVSDPSVQQRFHLSGGRLALSFNCDAFTCDRESVQAAKQFHLHLLYWSATELNAIATPEPVSATSDPRERRQLLDPLSFLSGKLIAAALDGLDLSPLGGRIVTADPLVSARGERPGGCLIELPGWSVLDEPAFETLVRDIHRRLSALSSRLYQAITGQHQPPPPWQRHALRPAPERRAALQALGLSSELEASLAQLFSAVRDLRPLSAARLKRASPAARQHCMTLNQPCYGLNLYAPHTNTPEQPVIASRSMTLLLSAKLFSGIGCAGLLPLGTVPSVRVVRNAGEFSRSDWHRRAAWQQAFACRLHQRLTAQPNVNPEPVKRLRDLQLGWC